MDYGYGPGKGRPVYFCSGEPQVRGEFKNATTGVASTAGKFASCFALGAKILKDYYPEFAAEIEAKADAAYQEGVKNREHARLPLSCLPTFTKRTTG